MKITSQTNIKNQPIISQSRFSLGDNSRFIDVSIAWVTTDTDFPTLTSVFAVLVVFRLNNHDPIMEDVDDPDLMPFFIVAVSSDVTIVSVIDKLSPLCFKIFIPFWKNSSIYVETYHTTFLG